MASYEMDHWFCYFVRSIGSDLELQHQGGQMARGECPVFIHSHEQFLRFPVGKFEKFLSKCFCLYDTDLMS